MSKASASLHSTTKGETGRGEWVEEGGRAVRTVGKRDDGDGDQQLLVVTVRCVCVSVCIYCTVCTVCLYQKKEEKKRK